MSIPIKRANFPQAVSIDDVPPETDYRHEVLNPAALPAQTSAVDRQIASLADSVVALVDARQIVKLENGSPQAYWKVEGPLRPLNDVLTRRLVDGNRAAVEKLVEFAIKNSKKTFKTQELQTRVERALAASAFKACFKSNVLTCAVSPMIKDQPVMAKGTGCLISRDYVLTCGHSDNVTAAADNDQPRFTDNPESLLVLFGFRNGTIQQGSILPRWQVREIEHVEVMPWDSGVLLDSILKDDRHDVAILRLKAADPADPVVPTVTVQRAVPRATDALTVIGCSNGIPLKYVQGTCLGPYQFPNTRISQTRFATDMQAFAAGSGSPVFNTTQGGQAQICGVLTSSRKVSYTTLDRPLKEEIRTVIQKLTGLYGEITDGLLEGLYHVRDASLLLSKDGTSFTFDKMFSDDPLFQRSYLFNRVDAVPNLLGKLADFAPPAANSTTYASVSVVLNFESKVTSAVTLNINTTGIGGQPGPVIQAIATPGPAQGNPIVYLFTDFGAPTRRLPIDQVNAALQHDLEDREMTAYMLSKGYDNQDDGYGYEFAMRYADDATDSNILWYRAWTDLWKRSVDARKTRAADPVPRAPLLAGGWTDPNHDALGNYNGFRGAPGLLGLLQQDALWVSKANAAAPLPLDGKITVLYEQGATDERVMFQSRITFEEAERPGAGNAGKIFGRADRWMGPLANPEHMFTEN